MKQVDLYRVVCGTTHRHTAECFAPVKICAVETHMALDCTKRHRHIVDECVAYSECVAVEFIPDV